MQPKTILITGANGGLGQAIARAFLAEPGNHFVWLGVHTQREQAEQLTQESPGQCACLALDVCKPEDWRAAVATILSRHTRLDVLVNNAGGHEDALLATMNLSTWRRVLDANLDGVYHGCQAVLPAMISQRWGRIINLSSLSALLAPAGQANYAAAKAAVLALTQSLAKEVARIGITVNAICPGYIESGAVTRMLPEERKAALARIPMRRFGQPGEVAAAVRFLASDDSSYITGAVLKIDGGVL